jgi:maltose alpha-D-glucosyltransferase/alpha-amylase
MTEPLWYKDAIIYELRTRSYYDSDGDGVGDLIGLSQKLDYLKDLGITALWLLPFYPSPLRDDGYDIADYTSVHAAVGKIGDFKHFLEAAHARGLKVITELVLNHTSDQHPWFQRARRAAPGSRERDFYVWTNEPSKWSQARIIFQDFETSNWSWDPVAKAYYWHRFFAHQPDLNFENPAVQEAMFGVVDFWFGMGVDGMRLDAVPYLYEQEGTTCENLPATHAFLKKLRAHIEAKFPNRMLLAEANQWPEDAVAYFGAGDECHMAFHFPIMPRLFMALRMEDSYPIIDILEQTPPIPENCQWAIFLRNHDELTLEMVTDEERDYMVERYAADRQTRINLGIRRRLAPLLQNDRRRLELMNLLLFSLPGTPVVYYGDEIGMGDNPYLGDRDGVRTPMQWSADRNGGFSRANPQKLILPLISDPEYSFETVNVEVQENNQASLLWWMKRVIALRRRHVAFGRGSLHMLAPENRKVLAFLRRYAAETLLVVINLSRFPQWVELDLAEFVGVQPVELMGNIAFPSIAEGPYRLTLGGHDALWFSLSRTPATPRVRPSAAQRIPPRLFELAGEYRALLSPGSALEAALTEYVPVQRWFRSKAREVTHVALLDTVPLADVNLAGVHPEARSSQLPDDVPRASLPPDARASLTPETARSFSAEATRHLYLGVISVSFTDGEAELYALPLRYAAQAEEPPRALLGLQSPGDTVPSAWLTDASGDAVSGAALQAVALGQLELPGSRVRLLGRRLMPDLPEDAVANATPVKALGTEQSNTSYTFGQQFIGKLVRKVEVGGSIEVEVLSALQSAELTANVPGLIAQAELDLGSGAALVWMTQSFIPNEGDAWHVTIDHAQRYYEDVLSECRERPAPAVHGVLRDSLADEDLPENELLGEFLPLARLLGQRTAELHLALAVSFKEGEFAARPYTALSTRSYYQSVRNLSAKAMDALRAAMLPADTRDLARQVLGHHEQIKSVIGRVLSQPLSGVTMRVHGDYHLGQVLYTGRDFYIIDFEGEPARSLQERRRRRSPMADVAGMLRSFHYASFGVLTGELPGAQIRPDDRALLEPWGEFFYHSASREFLRAYLSGVDSAQIVPTRGPELQLLLGVHLLEKALYELLYELNNRPDWAELPLRGILSALS